MTPHGAPCRLSVDHDSAWAVCAATPCRKSSRVPVHSAGPW